MSKINLLTMHYGISYGAALQTYATCKVLKQLGHNVTIINLQDKKTTLLSSLKKWRFNRFYNKYYPPMTKLMSEPRIELMPEADYYMVGSDQVWNPDITKKQLLNYFLNFVPPGCNRISYASSFGKSKWINFFSETEIRNIEVELKKFNALSVRESDGVAICKNYFGIDATQVLDPTLILEDYSELIGNTKNRNEIVCFFIGFKKNKESFLNIVNYVKNELNIPATYLDATFFTKEFNNHCIMPGPDSWLQRLNGSKFIITSSYHGLAFALIFRKPFLVLQADPLKVIRLKSLLNLLNLEDRLVLDANELKNKKELLNTAIDYNHVQNVLDSEKNKSFKFLKDQLLN